MNLNYPLEQLLTIKKNRFDQAVKVLEEKKSLFAKAQAKFQEAVQKRDVVLQHKQAKLEQLREELDRGTTTDKIQVMKRYLKVVDEQLAEKERKMAEEQKQMDLAQKQVDLAHAEMLQKRRDLEKMELHKEEWKKEARLWIEQKEEVEHDEQGASTHALRKQQAEKERE